MPHEKEVGSIDCTIDDDLLIVAIQDGYPCYFGGIAFTIDNLGSVPVKILHMKLTHIMGTDITDVDLVKDTQYYVDAETLSVSTTHDLNGTDTDDFSFVISHLDVGDQIGAAGWADDALFGDLAVHVEQGAQQNAGKAGGPPPYTFTIEIKCAQWNEVPFPHVP
jgi:hypothetical protein